MGIMGGKNSITNIEIEGREFFRLKSLVKRYFNINGVERILYVVKGKTVYEVIVDSNESYRLDIYKIENKKKLAKKFTFYREREFYQNIAYENGVHVPKAIGLYKTPDCIYKLSDWIKGKRIGYYWNLPHVFKKAGIEVAKINCIKDPNSDKFLGYNDLTKPNAIWTTMGEIYLVDVIIEPKRDVEYSVVKILLKNLGDKERIKWFLKGYSTVRNSYLIQKELESRNYKW